MREETENVALCEVLDRVLNKGAVIVGDVTISVANVDLIYLGLQLILSSVETGRRLGFQDSHSELDKPKLQ
ncbi:MAG: gas vesicle protein [Syntrophaceae bacterium]|nr:gas vesicle protein [Syntrophaceae bacterium]